MTTTRILPKKKKKGKKKRKKEKKASYDCPFIKSKTTFTTFLQQIFM